MELTEKIKIDTESFNNVLKMLNSSNQEDAITALMAMEQMDFKSGSMFFAILYKNTISKTSLWETNAPNLLKNINFIGVDTTMSYKSIWNKLKDTSSQEEKKLFASMYAADVIEILNDWGFKGMLEDFVITITCKNVK